MRVRPPPNGPELPDGIPVLARGWHGEPALGACLMEYASLLAGEQFTDHPRCTHPVLAALCRAVNDVISDQGRQRLAELAPDVIGTRGHDPAVSAGVVLISVDAACALRAPDEIVVAGRRHALRRLEAKRRGRIRRACVSLTEGRAGMRAAATVRRCAAVVAGAGDEELVRLLKRAIGYVHECRAVPRAMAPRSDAEGLTRSRTREGLQETVSR